MEKEHNYYSISIDLALKNLEKRLLILSKTEKKCLVEEYKEWLKFDFSLQTILFIREDPII